MSGSHASITALREATIASVLFALFGLAVVCALGAIVAFTTEMFNGRHRHPGRSR